jgi:hypothetical protein
VEICYRNSRNSGLYSKQNGNGTASWFLLLLGLIGCCSILRVGGKEVLIFNSCFTNLFIPIINNFIERNPL